MTAISSPTVPRAFTFVGGAAGEWRVESMSTLRGESIPAAPFVSVRDQPASTADAAWVLRGVTSNERYTTAVEHTALVARQPAIGRPEATMAAMIPLTKSAAWWALSQDQRRTIFEERSRHISASIELLPAVARRLHHSRDLGEPFDFITWFEFAAADTLAFDQLLRYLRATEEWSYVEREIEIRLTRAH